MTKEEIRAKLKISVKLNPKGAALEEGREWRTYDEYDGGNYNGYVTIPGEFEKYFPTDEWNDIPNLPTPHGGLTFAEYGEDGLTVGFDTLHFRDKSSYWTEERTIAEAEEWADNIADRLVGILEDIEQRDKEPYMTAAELIALLRKYDADTKLAFSCGGTTFKRLREWSLTFDNVLNLSCECEIPD